MIRTLSLALAAALALSAAPMAQGQNQQPAEYVPPAGVEMEIVLYPSTRFRGNAKRFRESDRSISIPIPVQSIYLVRGRWQLCNLEYYNGRCVSVSGSQQAVSPEFPVRSIRLVGDTGPTFVESPVARMGPDIPFVTASPETSVAEIGRAPAAPVVAPAVADGGAAGNNPSLAGRAVEFFPAPAQNGARVLACAQLPNTTPNPRCTQAAADGFCAAEGFRDSGWREYEMIENRAYLVNVLCKQADDSSGARDASVLRIPFF